MEMNRISEVEKELLSLPAAEREQLALRAWESLVEDKNAQSNPNIDKEGIELATTRDGEIEKGTTELLSKEEFLRRTSDDS